MPRCSADTKSSDPRNPRRCRRNCAEGTDFCKQHNPLTKMDDITCAVCLDEIKNPMKMRGCSHVFCKGCIAESVLRAGPKCPCCRESVCSTNVKECIKVTMGSWRAEKFALDLEIAVCPYKWYGTRPWTQTMRKRYFAIYPNVSEA